ncbi:sugar O-acyltransferase, sialic acid O-acetyltransferase NeuD family [Marinitoga piezophila KA3]|uniref:Sugar O-acyltransferase, sialic acid O-acetyltransferase NeuD family n=1 Tax=Marinitoga piezophila (strain DSM 14283 / JCM 11233 / KA3) TaxID=443254 RepID=H2J2X1_MARPK|nr:MULTISPECIES: acetyltransferase [Marinitoga]AEX85662.1 sugar O-acyltransferase, sialic acid O-acetyltransferase NeuD family [Marinitoga piezophila KA3]APT76114.1 serine acetyltransferase [Marinitoga sp. 1137]
MSSKEKIILVGGGGHCKVVASIIFEKNEYEIIGISDLKTEIGKEIMGIKINYIDEQLEELYKTGIKNAFVTVGSVGNPDLRIKLFKKLKDIGFNLPVIISKHTIISKDVSIGEGTVIMPGVIVNPGVKIERNCIINTGAIIEHDCIIEDNVHIAPGVTLSGGVKIGENSHIGTGTSIIQNIEIGKNVLIGAGSVVVNNIPDNTKAFGVPAKIKSVIDN